MRTAAILIFALTTVFAACDKSLPPAENPKTVKPAPPVAQQPLPATTEQKLVAANMIFNLIKAQCNDDFQKARAANDRPAFKTALEDCAARFEAFTKTMEKIKKENRDPQYNKTLENLVILVRKLAKLHRDIAACYKPGATDKEIDECGDEVLKKFAAEMKALQGGEK